MTGKITERRCSRDPKEELELRRAEASCVLADALLAAQAADPSLTRPVVAASVGGSPTLISTMCDPEHGRALDVARASMLPDEARRILAQWIVGDGYCVLRVGVDVEAGAIPPELIAQCQRSTSLAVSQALDGASDGYLDAFKGAALESSCDVAIAKLLALRELARLAQRERVIAVPGPARVQ